MMTIKQRLIHWIGQHEALSIGFVALFVFMLGIWRQPFINFETRFAVFAQEMLRNGPTLFPTTYGLPYPDYPVTSTLITWLLSLPFGEVTKFTAVLPTALATAAVVALSYRLFAQYSRQWAVLTVCFEFLTLTFVAEARSISIDQMLSAVTLAAFYLTNRSYREKTALPIPALLFLLLAGFLIRGPIGVVIPAGVVLSHLVWTSDRRQVFTFSAYSAGVLIIGSATLLGLATLFYGKDFVAEIVKMQAVSRFAENSSNPFHYYLTSSLGNYALSYPIALLVAIFTLISQRTKTTPRPGKEELFFIVLLASWATIVLIGLSIPETKKVRYILPIVPALAGLASYVFIRPEDRLTKWLRRFVEVLLASFPLLAMALVYAKRAMATAAGIPIALVEALLFFMFLTGLVILVRKKISGPKCAMLLCLTGAITAYFLQTVVVEPIDQHLHDTSGFVHRIEALVAERPGKVVFYKENPDGLPIKYWVNANKDELPLFISNPTELYDSAHAVWLLTRDRNVSELKVLGADSLPFMFHDDFAGTAFSILYIPAHTARPATP